MVQSMLALLFAVSTLGLLVSATRVGDRHHGNTEEGLFYFFGSNITIIDPETGDIVNVLEGATSWGDVVYMRDQAQIRHYAFGNDGDKNDMVVIDCDAQEILSHVRVGSSPVHMYAIPPREEVWTHPDDNGTFDIIHMSDIEYLVHSNLKAHDVTPGHGKLLWDPNLQEQGFATNTQEPKIYEINLEDRSLGEIINMTLDDAPYPCARTHGIGYTWVNDHLYVECSHPSECTYPDNYTDGTICSGSTWEVDVATLKPVARLVSPALNEALGNDFGVQGQVYMTPDEKFVVVTNKYQNYVHFLQPVNGGDTNIVDVIVSGTPGKVAFYPKGNEDVWGPDSDVSDYYVIIAQEEQEETSGIVMIDLKDIYQAFEDGDQTPDVDVTYITLGAGGKYRPIMRGSHYAATPSGATSEYGSYTFVSVVDLETKELKYNLEIEGVRRVLWVPTHDDEQVAEHEIRISALEDFEDPESDTEIIAEVALALAVVGCFAGLLALGLAIRHARHAKVANGGDYKPFLCL